MANKQSKAPSMAARIRTLLAGGRSPAEIAALLNITRQRVYVVKSADKRRASTKRKYVKSGLYSKKKPVAVTQQSFEPFTPPPLRATVYLTWRQRMVALIHGTVEVQV